MSPLPVGSSATQDEVPADLVTRELEAILAQSEYQPEEGSFGLAEWLTDLFSSVGATERAVDIAMWAAMLVAAIATTWFLMRALRAGSRPRQRSESGPEDPAIDEKRDAEWLLRLAGEARAGGDLRGALRWTWSALVVGLGQRGTLRYRDAWTNRELLERGDPEEASRELLAGVMREIEEKEFGNAETTEDDVERLDALCRRMLAEGTS